MDKETILARVSLPCSVSQLESAVLRAAHAGHWDSAQVREVDGTLEVFTIR